MHSSKSFPSDMTSAVQQEMSQTKRHSTGTKSHPVVNLNYMDNSDNTTNIGRTDSYRVAMVTPARSGSYRVAMNETASYPSFNNMSRRSTTPRVNVTNQMISQSHVQQESYQNRQSDQYHQNLTPDQNYAYDSQQGHQTLGGSGKGRYNPLYAATADSVKMSSSQPSQYQKHLSQNQSEDQSRSRRLSYDKEPSPSQGHHQKHPSPSQGHHQKLPSPSQGHHQRHPSPSQGHRKKLVSPSQDGQSNYNGRLHESSSSPSFHNSANYQKQLQATSEMQSNSYVNSTKNNSKLNQSDSLKHDSRNSTLPHSKSYPNTNMPVVNQNDLNSRTDSYRVALGTNYDNPNRNTSYRVAVKDTDPLIPDNRLDVMDVLTSGGRDSRRMGITNIDQVKRMPEKNETTAESQKQQVVRRRKPDVDPISVLSNRESNTSKTNKNRFSTSSTFIQFDPISEDWEFMMNSSDSISQFSNGSDRDLLDYGDIASKDTFKVNAMSGKMSQEKSSSSLLGSIKSTLKSMSGKQSKDCQDEGRFSLV